MSQTQRDMTGEICRDAGLDACQAAAAEPRPRLDAVFDTLASNCLQLGGFEGSATKGQFRKCGLTVSFQNMTQRNEARVCNKAFTMDHAYIYIYIYVYIERERDYTI